jgi:ubiquinone/menaquinone biosynthesis C-methylase UbiE
MARLSPARRLLKVIHPEGIPWPATALYNAISAADIFQRNYEWVAQDIAGYCPQGSILDVGTGPGWLLIKLQRQSPGSRIVGLDASPAMVAKAQKNVADAGLADAIEVHEGNASHIPFDDGSFDAVVSTGSIHHWKEPAAALNEVYRVLRRGGHALMYDIVSDTPASVLRETAREFGRLKMWLFWLHAFEEPFYSRRDFELLAAPTSFKEGRVRFVGVQCCLILKKAA